MNNARVLGIAGWSGSGKTTLILRVLPVLARRGLRVATLKHAHHSFDVDHPGKDSYEHRKAGAREVIVSSARRWVQMHELAEESEATLAELLARVSPCDLVLVEGYKNERFPKLEVFRKELGKAALHPADDHIVGVVSNQAFPDAAIPVIDIDDIGAVADAIHAHAVPVAAVLERLRRGAQTLGS